MNRVSAIPVVPAHLDRLETPCIVIDSEAVDRNIQRMAQTVAELGVKLRPHAKTHKLPEMAARQLAAGADGITVAKLAEAEIMAANGIKDLFIAYPLIGRSKLERVIKLSESCSRLILGVDSLAGAQALSAIATEHGIALEVRLEVESGLRRTGVEAETAVALAQEIAALPSLALTGIFTYRGPIMLNGPTLDVRAAGHEEGQLMVAVADKLRQAGIAIKDVSVGSSPTAIYAAEVEGITEVRPGTYIYQDRMQVEYGACELEDCAAVVWATVVSRPAPDRIIIDGGSKTFATDVQPDKAPLHLHGFGHLTGDSSAIFERMNEEHGVIIVAPESGYKIGDRIAIIPNHICSTVNLHNSVYLNDAAQELRQVPVAARGQLH